MAVIIDVAVPTKGELEFDFISQVITAEDTIDDLTSQELADAIRDAEDELIALGFYHIADMSGKANLGAGITSGIIIELLNGWLIVSGKTSGNFTLLEGTVVESTAGTNCFASNPLVNQINLAQVGGVIATGGSSPLTPEEHAKLFSVPGDVWDEPTEDHESSGSMGKKVGKKLATKNDVIVNTS